MGTGDHAGSLLRVLLKPNCAVTLYGNPWECPPAAVVAAGENSIRGYYNELKRHAPLMTKSLKVVLGGHSGAGKTRYLCAESVPLLFLHARETLSAGPLSARNITIEC